MQQQDRAIPDVDVDVANGSTQSCVSSRSGVDDCVCPRQMTVPLIPRGTINFYFIPCMGVVIPVERSESAELHLPVAQFFVGILMWEGLKYVCPL